MDETAGTECAIMAQKARSFDMMQASSQGDLRQLHQSVDGETACGAVHLVVDHFADVSEGGVDGADDEVFEQFRVVAFQHGGVDVEGDEFAVCLLYTSPSPRD